MLLFFPSQLGRISQARQNFASPNFCFGSRERFGAEQNQIPKFPHAYQEKEKPQCFTNFDIFANSTFDLNGMFSNLSL
jgi:hypothetical protein